MVRAKLIDCFMLSLFSFAGGELRTDAVSAGAAIWTSNLSYNAGHFGYCALGVQSE